MNLRLDLDGTLKTWPAPTRAESFWEERAHAIVRAALTENTNTKLLEALMGPPPLPEEPGAPSAPRAGEAPEPRSKRPSLREMAERHSSRVVHLRKQEEAAAMSRAASQGAANDVAAPAAATARTPVSTGAEPPAPAIASRSTTAAKTAKKKGSGGLIAGVAIAAMGIAAAFAITQRDRLTPPSMPSASAPIETERERSNEPPLSDKATPAATVAQAESTAERPADAPAPVAAGKGPRSDNATPLPTASTAPEIVATPTAAPTTPGPNPSPTEQVAPPNTIKSDDPRVLPAENRAQGEIKGDVELKDDIEGQSIPQQPSPGSISAALRSVMGSAKKCVAGADDVSRATITFGSDGAVKSVSVTGWAASNGATGCITAALKGANVGRFWKPSYTASSTITP